MESLAKRHTSAGQRILDMSLMYPGSPELFARMGLGIERAFPAMDNPITANAILWMLSWTDLAQVGASNGFKPFTLALGVAGYGPYVTVQLVGTNIFIRTHWELLPQLFEYAARGLLAPKTTFMVWISATDTFLQVNLPCPAWYWWQVKKDSNTKLPTYTAVKLSAADREHALGIERISYISPNGRAGAEVLYVIIHTDDAPTLPLHCEVSVIFIDGYLTMVAPANEQRIVSPPATEPDRYRQIDVAQIMNRSGC